jgi:putative membrane protein
VLGFVISYRTTSSFERYNEGRRLWSQIVLGSRVFARTIWFHVPGTSCPKPLKWSSPETPLSNYIDNTMPNAGGLSEDERRARTLVEKKTIINLLEAYAVSVKHYLRGEDGIFYADLYPLVKFLPPYALPASIPSSADLPGDMRAERVSQSEDGDVPASPRSVQFPASVMHRRTTEATISELPLPSTTPGTRANTLVGPILQVNGRPQGGKKVSTEPNDELYILPAQIPPKYSMFDLFPFSLLVKMLTKRGHDVKGKKAARLRAQMRNHRGGMSHNIPLEISLYLVGVWLPCPSE